MRSADWRWSACRRCTRPTAGRCGCAAARRACAAFETCHTRTAGARLASPAELHRVTAAAAGTNSFARGWLWHLDGDASLQHRCWCGPALAKYRPRCRSLTALVLSFNAWRRTLWSKARAWTGATQWSMDGGRSLGEPSGPIRDWGHLVV